MYDDGPGIDGIGGGYFPHKLQQWGWVIRHSMIRPHSIVELLHNPLLLAAVHLQREGTDGVLCKNQGVLEVDMYGAKDLCSLHLIWPVLVALDLGK